MLSSAVGGQRSAAAGWFLQTRIAGLETGEVDVCTEYDDDVAAATEEFGGFRIFGSHDSRRRKVEPFGELISGEYFAVEANDQRAVVERAVQQLVRSNAIGGDAATADKGLDVAGEIGDLGAVEDLDSCVVPG